MTFSDKSKISLSKYVATNPHQLSKVNSKDVEVVAIATAMNNMQQSIIKMNKEIKTLCEKSAETCGKSSYVGVADTSRSSGYGATSR